MVLVKKGLLISIWKQELSFFITFVVVSWKADNRFVKISKQEMTTIFIKD